MRIMDHSIFIILKRVEKFRMDKKSVLNLNISFPKLLKMAQ